jgi:aminodeoxyfutalosine synthase
MNLQEIAEKIYRDERITPEEGLFLFENNDIFTLGKLASYRCENKNGRCVYYIHNRHINPTNICVNRCAFCAFSRSKGDEGAYELDIKEIVDKAGEVIKEGARELHIVGGLHPDWPFDFYVEMLKSLKNAFPQIHLKAFTAVEIDYYAKISKMTVAQVLARLKDAGLESMPGGGAEIFDKEIRNRICPEKISGERWLEVMEQAHKVGIKTNATMLYGHLESYGERVDHLVRLRELQDRTGGFQAFIPLPFHPENTQINDASYTSGIDDLKTVAISRLMLDNFSHIKAYWIMLGEKVAQLALFFGANDLDGTVVEEKITRSAGGLTKGVMTKTGLINLIEKAGKVPVERDSFYQTL